MQRISPPLRSTRKLPRQAQSASFQPFSAIACPQSHYVRSDSLSIFLNLRPEQGNNALPVNAKNRVWWYSKSSERESRANESEVRPPIAIFFSTNMEQHGTVFIKFLSFSAPRRVLYGIPKCNNLASGCAIIALYLCQHCTKITKRRERNIARSAYSRKQFRAVSL